MGAYVKTIHRWDRLGNLHCFRTVGNHRSIPLSEINWILGAMHRDLINDPSQKKKYATYAHVSSHRQKKDGDLDRQLKTLTVECRKRFNTSPLVFSDIGSGLNMRRRGLSKLVSLAKNGFIQPLLITHKDRLTRFGLELLERILNDYGVKLEVLYQPEQLSPQEELVTDLMSLIASFSGRIYGLRAYQSKRVIPQKT